MSRKETDHPGIKFQEFRNLLKNTKRDPQTNWLEFNNCLKRNCMDLTNYFEIKDIHDYLEIISAKDYQPSRLDNQSAIYLSQMLNDRLTLKELLEIYSKFQSNKIAESSHDAGYYKFYNKIIELIQVKQEFHDFLKNKVFLQKADGAEASVAEKKVKGISFLIDDDATGSPQIVIEILKDKSVRANLAKFFTRYRTKSEGSSSVASASSADEEHFSVRKEHKSYKLTLEDYSNLYLVSTPSTSAAASAVASPARPLRETDEGNDLFT